MYLTRKFSFFLILLSALSVVGFVLIQYYWIKNAMNAHEANFDRSVHEAMSKVIYQTEKTEIANRIKGRLKSFKKGSILFQTVDSINQLLYRELEKMITDSLRDDSIINITKERISIEISQDNYGKPIKRIDTSVFIFQKKHKEQQDFKKNKKITGYDSLYAEKFDKINYFSGMKNINADSLMYEFDKFLKRTFIVSDIFEDLFSFSHYIPLEERIDTNLLDSIINKELLNKNINLDYEYGVFSSIDENFIYEKTGKHTMSLIDNGQAFLLYPSDFFTIPNYLFIYFPNRQVYLFKQMSTTLILSFFLITAIFVVFLYVLISFFRQKKLAIMRNDFINNMTHEFKTPISTIGLACEAIQDKSVNKKNILSKSYIDIISKENTRLGSMAEKILQTVIIDKGQLKLKSEIVDVHDVINKTINNIILQIEQNQGKITTELNAEKNTVFADKLHFSNVIYSLLDNANKYTKKKPEILVKTYNNDKDCIIVEISDNGIGVLKKHQKKIFEKFYRVPQGNIHDVKGFGLGLSYVKAIVEMHKGKISIDSGAGNGSTFRLIFSNYSATNTKPLSSIL